MAYSKPPSPHAPFHAKSSAPSKVQSARNVVAQCISLPDRKGAKDAIGYDEPGKQVPALRDGESLLTDKEIQNLTAVSTRQSDSLVKIFKSNGYEAEYEEKVRKVLEKILQKWKSKHRNAPAVLRSVRVRPKRHSHPPSVPLHTSENAVKRVTYESCLEDIEIGAVSGGKERTILLVEMKKKYDTTEYRRLSSATESVTQDKQSWRDIVYQCVMYSMKTQRSILRRAEDGPFVLVSLVLFKEASFLIKLTSNDWWDYLYGLDVQKYILRNAQDVVNMLQLYVLRAFDVNADTNALFSDTLRHDFSQVQPPNYLVEYPGYPSDAHVQALPKVRANHIRMCSLTDCVRTLIRNSTVYWPILTYPLNAKDQWCLKLEQDTSTQVVAKVVSALNYKCSDGVPKCLKDFLNILKLLIEHTNNERTAKYKSILDLHVCVTSRKKNKKSAVVVTKFKGDCVRAHANFLLDWKNRTGGAKEAFFNQVCDVCIGMLEDGLPYYHGDLRPANIAVSMMQEATSTGTGADASTKPKATEQNGYILSVIDWDDVRMSGIFNTDIEGDNFYPYAKCTGATEQLASAAYTAYQLLLCIYILHRVAKGGADDSFVRANDVEFNLRYCNPIFTTLVQAHASEAKQMRLGDTPTRSTADSGASAIDTNFLFGNPTPEEQEKRAEYDSFQKWIRKIGANVFSDLNALLTDQSQCDQSTFDLLRNHLKVAIRTDLDE